MATKVKPSRLQVSGTPQAGCVPVYVSDDCFQWGSGGGGGGGGAEWGNITGTLCNQIDLQGALNCKLDASALSNTNYGGAWSGDTTHTATKNAIYTKLHTMDVEIGNKAADNTVVKLSGNQTIAGTKTFSTSPVVPNKCAAVVNCGTAIATEAQVYNIATSAELKCNMVCNLTDADNSHYPSAKAVADALSCAGAGDMLKSVYDPNNVSADAFDYCNFINTPTIPTDNCQLANSCGYTTCTGTVSTCADVISALGYTPYSTGNPCNYINSFAGVISALGYTPYNATNPCGYTTCTGTLSTCADVIGALGYTPYNSTNPCGYTTCTGTLVAGDISGLVAENCIACINGCCLTQGGNICICGGGGGGGIQLAPNSEYNVAYHWYGPQACYDALSQYYTCCVNDTAYFTTNV